MILLKKQTASLQKVEYCKLSEFVRKSYATLRRHADSTIGYLRNKVELQKIEMEKKAEIQRLDSADRKEERDLKILQLNLEQHKTDLETTRLQMEMKEKRTKIESDEKHKDSMRELLRRNCH